MSEPIVNRQQFLRPVRSNLDNLDSIRGSGVKSGIFNALPDDHPLKGPDLPFSVFIVNDRFNPVAGLVVNYD